MNKRRQKPINNKTIDMRILTYGFQKANVYSKKRDERYQRDSQTHKSKTN